MKVLFIANCHAKPLSIICNTLCPSVSFDWVEVNRLSETDRESVTTKIRQADRVLYYPVSDSWPRDFVRTSFLRETARSAISLTNVYFAGLHPDITLTGRGGARLQSPLADYHSRTVLMSYLNGLDADKALKLVYDAGFAEKFGYINVWHDSLAELKRRSDAADIHFYDEFVGILHERLPLFVVNHPVTHLLFIYAKKILAHIDLPALALTADCFPQWMLSNAVFPVFPYISETFDLPYSVGLLKSPKKDGFIEMPDFVKQCYEMYQGYPREDLVVMDKYAEWKTRFLAAL